MDRHFRLSDLFPKVFGYEFCKRPAGGIITIRQAKTGRAANGPFCNYLALVVGGKKQSDTIDIGIFAGEVITSLVGAIPKSWLDKGSVEDDSIFRTLVW